MGKNHVHYHNHCHDHPADQSDVSKAASRINVSVQLDSAKVASVVHVDDMKAGGKTAYCRCWRSAKFPLCDGSHGRHNQQTGDNVGPLIVDKSARV